MAEHDKRRRRRPGTSRGTEAGRGAPSGTGGGRGPRREPDRARQPQPLPHTLRLEVGGQGFELRCDTCELVVTHLAEPQVRPAVEAAHRRHLGSLTWESAWVGICSCGWRTGRLNQQQATEELDAHEASVLLPAARGEPPPPPPPPR